MFVPTNPYLPAEEIAPLKQQGWRVYQLLNGYIRYLRDQKAGGSLGVHESSAAYGLTDDTLDLLHYAPLGSRLNDSTV